VKHLFAALLLTSGLLVAGGANAQIIITLTETGGNVVATGSGSINTQGSNNNGSIFPRRQQSWIYA
jgi:hypothetical protein